MTEAQWQQTVLELAGYYRWSAYHPYDSRRSQPGWPDLVLARVPELMFCELKTNHGRVRPAQRAWMDRLEACGQEVHLWRPVDLDAVHERLKRPYPSAA